MNALLSKFVLFQVYYPVIATFLLCAVKSLAIVALGGLGAVMLRKRSAAARCWVWRAVLAGCLALPLFDFGAALTGRLRVAWRHSLSEESSQDFARQANALHLVYSQEEMKARREAKASEDLPAGTVVPPWHHSSFHNVSMEDFRPTPWRQLEDRLVFGWWAVAGCFGLIAFTRMGVGFWTLRKNARVAGAAFQQKAETAATLLKLRRRPRVWIVRGLHSPLMAGWVYPGVYLPETAQGWTAQRCEEIFLHELAHWRRGDQFWQLIGRLGACVFWWQPLVAWSARQMNAEAEGAADDAVLLHRPEGENYAATLVEIAAGGQAVPAVGVPMVGYRSLEKRIRSLLHANPWRGRIGRLGVGVVVALGLVSLATASFYVVQAANDRVAAVKPHKIVKLSDWERKQLERVRDNTLRRLGALRFLHFKLEESTRREEAGQIRISPQPTKMEAWVDQWTGIHRVEYRPRVLVWIDGASPFAINDSTAINDGKSYLSYDDYDFDAFRPRSPEGLQFYLGLQESTDLLQIARVMLGTGSLFTHESNHSIEPVIWRGRPALQIRQKLNREDGEVYQQQTFIVDPAEDDMLVFYEFARPSRTPNYPSRWEAGEIGRTSSGARYALAYQRTHANEKAKTTSDIKVTQLDVLNALPAGITEMPKRPGSEYIAKEGKPIRHPRLVISYTDATKPLRPVASVVATVTINRNAPVELRADAKGQLAIPLPDEEITYLGVTAAIPGFARQSVRWQKQGDALQIPEAYLAKLWPGSPIGGKVIDEEGRPVSNAEVRVWRTGRNGASGVFEDRFALWEIKAVTDAKGFWQLDDFPADLSGLGFRIHASGFQASTAYGYEDFRRGTGLEYSVLKDRSWAYTLKRGESLNGTLSDVNGLPVRNARLVVGRDIHGSNPPEGKSDADGGFSLKNLPPGPFTLTVESLTHQPQTLELSLPLTEPLKVRLHTGGVIRGRVVDESGAPCAGMNVGVDTWKKVRTLAFSTQTDADGRFTWKGAPEEPVTFVFGACQGGKFLSGLPLSPKAEEQLIEIKPGLRMRAKVLDADTKKPVASFKVSPGRAYDDSDVWWDEKTSQTHSLGQFTWETHWFGQAHKFRIQAEGYEAFESPAYAASQSDVSETFLLKRAVR
ncbi:M56 family metallopeptidase [Rariglobus hedericola]|nr:M56 family metallopeptidase [Rariglobus hedericola]